MAAEALTTHRRALPSEVRAAWMFVGPGLAVIFLFFLLPIAAALLLSLTDFDLYALADLSTLRFVGLDNYAHLLRTPLFWQALGNTLYFVAVGVPLSLALSLGAALLLSARVTRWQGLFRTALFAPVVTTVVAVAVIWRYLLHTRYGLVNQALAAIGIDPIDWLGDPHWSMPAITRRWRGVIATAAAAVMRSGTCSGSSSRVSGGCMTKSIAARADSLTHRRGRTRSK